MRLEPNLKLNAPHTQNEVKFDRDDDLVAQGLRSRLEDPDNPKDDTFWLIDKGTGNTPKVDIDFRFRLNGQTYSVFDGVAGVAAGISVPIAFGDWVQNGEYYEIDLVHNLGANCVDVTFREGNCQVWVDKVEFVDANTERVRVACDPDCRFVGQACFIKVS